MKFNKKYPNQEVSVPILFEGDEYTPTNEPGFCWACKRDTNWVSIAFGAYLCSEECATEKWNEYIEATRKGLEYVGEE